MRGLVLCLVLAGCARWATEDTVLQAAVVTTTAIDWQQTVWITNECREINPVIGQCGENIPVHAYFPVVIVVSTAIAVVLPKRWRNVFQAFVLGMEAATTYSNYRVR
ncbi:MAG TPA: hypothetical protein VFS15_18940 [Kofleriaceae bacterium]|nr:hypothetical protein [Kofleriaceae bacterium]